MEFPLYVALLTILDASAILCSRVYVDTKKIPYLIISLSSFALCAYIIVFLMAFRATAIINILWVSFSTVLITLVCYFLFKERINLRQGLGIALILFGIIIMEF